MGFFDFFRKPKATQSQSGPSTDTLKQVSEFFESDSRTAVIRDYGMQSRNVREALEVLHEAAPTMPGLSLFLDQQGFRSMNRSIRDMNEAARQNLLLRCETTSVINCVADRAMDLSTNLIVSEGFKVESTAKDPNNKTKVQQILDNWWEYNNRDQDMYDDVRDLLVCGERIGRLPPGNRKIGTVNPEIFNPGIFRLGLVLPHLVRGCSLTPWNYKILDKLYLQDYTYEKMNLVERNERIELKIVTDESVSFNDFGNIRGEVFYTSINRRPGTTRGLSRLATVVDWLDLHDKAFMSDVERAEMMKRFIWDVTLEGASPKQIEEYARKLKIGGPASGSVRVHGHKEVWDAVSPDLKVGELGEMRNQLFLHIWGGLGLPEHFFVSGNDSNRAVSDNMTDPCMAWARTLKRTISQSLELEARYAIQVAWEAGRLEGVPTEELGCRIVSRDPDRKGYEGVGAAWSDVANSLTLLENQQLIDKQSAADIVRVVLGAYGFEIDPELLQLQLAQQAGIPQDPNAPGAQPPGGPGGAPGQVNSAGQGMMGSNNPLDAILNEAYTALEKCKREERDLPKRF